MRRCRGISAVVGVGLVAGLLTGATAASGAEREDDEPDEVLAAALADPAALARAALPAVFRGAGLNEALDTRSFVPTAPSGQRLAESYAARIRVVAGSAERSVERLRSVALAERRVPPPETFVSRRERGATGTMGVLLRSLLRVGAARPSGLTVGVGAGQACVVPARRGRPVDVRPGACPGAAPFVDRTPVRTAAILLDRLVRLDAASSYLSLAQLARAFGIEELPTTFGRVAWSPDLLRVLTSQYVGVPVSGLRGRPIDSDGRVQLGWPGFTRCLSLNAAHPLAAGAITWGPCSRLPHRTVVLPSLPPPPPWSSPVVASSLVAEYVAALRAGATPAEALTEAARMAAKLSGVINAGAVSTDPPWLEVQFYDGVLCVAMPVFDGEATFTPPAPSTGQEPNTFHEGVCWD